MLDPVLAARYRALGLGALAREASPFRELPPRLLVVDAVRQRIGLLEEGALAAEYPVSTAARGLGCAQDSYRTPVGWHRIHRRIGEGEPAGAVFRAQVPTGERWSGEPREEDLILTRILTLEGLEEGVNRGPGCDSLARWIYVHGTNQEEALGTPCSHGCVRLGNADMLELFGRVREGDALLVAPPKLEPAGALGLGRLHFVGVGGSGMSALAQFVAMKGGAASGSDRSFDAGRFPGTRARLEALGVSLRPQDGSGVAGASAVVYSTAVEETVPDFAEARRLQVPLLHRSELLAHLVATTRSLAITGTSGKSSAVAMAFTILKGAGLDPSLLTGGELVALQREGLLGNAWAGGSELLVLEADESDGSLVRYRPAVGTVLNLQRDHKEPEAVLGMFRQFRAQVREAFLVGEGENLSELRPGAMRFGFEASCALRAEDVEEDAEGCRFTVQGVPFRLPVPGRHNVENALAAIASCRALGVPLDAMPAPLAAYAGVHRRFQVLGARRGVTVVDDFGHNPAKVAASLRTAKTRAPRVLAVFQPHGYGPLRFLREDFVAAFRAELRPQDRLWFLPVFYAGGTVTPSPTSAEVVADFQSPAVASVPDRSALVAALAAEAREGDLVLVMGARDPSLTELAGEILEALA
jgi:UDP-N-acetylmuramate--alanine ligase